MNQATRQLGAVTTQCSFLKALGPVFLALRKFSRNSEPVLINTVEQLSEEQRKGFRMAAKFQNVSWSFNMVHAPEEAEASKYPRYDQSKRTVPLVLDPDGAYRLDRSQQRGRLLLYVQPYQKSFRVRIGDREFEEHPSGFPYRFYYDPEFEEIIKIDAP